MVGRGTLAVVRLTWMVIGLAAAGCSFESGQVPNGDATDAPPPDTVLPLDSDSDGVMDSADNCPIVANTNQLDHDADDRGDVCDRCPHIPNPGDPDGDNDGVGDECDPRPTQAGDVRVLWEGFYDGAGIATWTKMGTWSVSGGTLLQAATAGETTMTLPTMFQRPYVATAFKVSSLSGATSLIGTCSSISAAQYYCCLLRNTGPVLNAVSSGAVTENQNVTWTGQFGAGDRLALIENVTTAHECVAEQSATKVSKSTMLGATSGKLQLYMRDAAAEYEYLFVVEIGQ
jgi:hypothetical protein